MSSSSSKEDRLAQLEHAVAEMFPNFKTLTSVDESHLHLILTLFQSLQRYRDEYVSSLRLIANDPVFTAAASRQQILDQITRYQMESDFVNEAMNDILSKLRKSQFISGTSFSSTVRTRL